MASTMMASMGRTMCLNQQRPATRSRAARMVPQAVATGGNTEGIWLPGVEAPKRLEGLVGNRGFDPFNFAVDPARLEWCGPHGPPAIADAILVGSPTHPYPPSPSPGP